jgi:5'-3' exonuclease
MSKTLLVDGDNLLTIGFYGLKNHFYNGQHIGGIFHFIDTLRRSFDTYQLNKICVFWDGQDSSISRKKLYFQYKENRKKRLKTEEEISSYERQRNRVKQYLEELFVRQGEFEFCESDDCIAYYTKNSPGEKKIVYSSDRDLIQLISDDTEVYSPKYRKIFSKNDFIDYDDINIPVENVKVVKILCGDTSDNISGIKGLGIKTLVSFFPEILTKEMTLQEIRNRSNVLFEKDKHSKVIKNFLTGVTKLGVLGEEFFYINEKMVCLNEPILTDVAKQEISFLIDENLDKDGRSYKNTMKMMMEDGIFKLLPKSDDAWIKFLNPFLRLTRIEKNKTRTIKMRNYE